MLFWSTASCSWFFFFFLSSFLDDSLRSESVQENHIDKQQYLKLKETQTTGKIEDRGKISHGI